MRWLWLVVFIGLAVAKPNGCNLAEFEYRVRTLHNPTERHEFALKWIEQFGSLCTAEQLTWLWNNSPDLMGTADTPQWRYKLTNALGER